MRPQFLLVLASLVVLACAWSKEDHEIFRLRDEIEKSEGVDVTFYDFLGVKPSASHEEILKAFKKRSRSLHPDKLTPSFIASRSTGAPSSKGKGKGKKPGVHVSKGPTQREIQKFVGQATERYGRLGVVADILKGPGRARYDHFLKNGFPAWRGTGYYYTRFRPGLGSVLVGLFIFGGGLVHYGTLVLSWQRQRDFVDRYIRHARKQAWGDETGIRGIPGIDNSTAYTPPPTTDEADPAANLNRRQKREMERQNKKESKSGKKSRGTNTPDEQSVTAAPSGQKKRVVAENGKILVVDSLGNVFLEEEDDEGNVDLFQLDIDEIPRPTFRDTAVYQFPVFIFRKAFDPFTKNTTPVLSGVSSKVAETTQIEVAVAQQDSSQDSETYELIDSKELPADATGTSMKKRAKKSKK